MKSNAFEKLSIFELTAQCEEVNRISGRATDNGQYKIVNKQNGILLKLWRELKRRGQEGRTILLHLMNNTDPWVRLWAAACALSLSFVPDRAEQVLSEIETSGSPLARATAEMCLQEWRKGTLKLPD